MYTHCFGILHLKENCFFYPGLYNMITVCVNLYSITLHAINTYYVYDIHTYVCIVFQVVLACLWTPLWGICSTGHRPSLKGRPLHHVLVIDCQQCRTLSLHSGSVVTAALGDLRIHQLVHSQPHSRLYARM